jgi:hypothetical protein
MSILSFWTALCILPMGTPLWIPLAVGQHKPNKPMLTRSKARVAPGNFDHYS